jgi:hypothetical protein
MAEIHVLISQQDDETILDHWFEYEGRPLDAKKWMEGSGRWPAQLLKGRPKPLEVFLCLDGESLAAGYNSPFVADVIRQAHMSMWGANVYLVIDSLATSLQPDGHARTRHAPPAWFEAASENNVRDVLHWPIRRRTDFSDASRKSEKRIREVSARDTRRAWKCLVSPEPGLGPEQESFLGPYLINSFRELGDSNCLLVLQEKRDDYDYMAYVRRHLRRMPGTEMAVGVIDRVEEPPTELERYCREKGCALVRFHGWCELYYALRRLNAPLWGDATDVPHATPVPVSNPAFKSHPPRLLITHAYVPSDPEGCHSAARDAWELTKELRGRAEVTVYPAVQCLQLAGLVRELEHVLGWVHIGHGDDALGLLQSGAKGYKPAEDWLRSFADYKSSLALAVFSSCKSEPVAKAFAESGVGVTVGFRQKVHRRVCAELTKRVVEATLDANGLRRPILEAFRDGRLVLEIEDPEALPVAFWARH